jgi:hypothetical protein
VLPPCPKEEKGKLGLPSPAFHLFRLATVAKKYGHHQNEQHEKNKEYRVYTIKEARGVHHSEA